METSTFKITIAHNASTSTAMLKDSLKLAIETYLRNIDSVSVESSEIEEVLPPMFYYTVVVSNGRQNFLMPISSIIEGATDSQISELMTSRNLIPQGFSVLSIEEVSQETYTELQDNLDHRDPRWEDTFERSSSPKYYRIVGDGIEGVNSIMSTKILFDTSNDFKKYAVRLGKADFMGEISMIEQISKDDYFCTKYGADGKSEEWIEYKIFFTDDEGEEESIQFKTKFIFSSNDLVFAQAVRKGKINAEAIMASVTQVQAERSEDSEIH